MARPVDGRSADDAAELRKAGRCPSATDVSDALEVLLDPGARADRRSRAGAATATRSKRTRPMAPCGSTATAPCCRRKDGIRWPTRRRIASPGSPTSAPSLQPDRRANSYPFAYEQAAQLFDHPCGAGPVRDPHGRAQLGGPRRPSGRARLDRRGPGAGAVHHRRAPVSGPVGHACRGRRSSSTSCRPCSR